MNEEKFIRFTIAPYCLPKLLLAFYNTGIHDNKELLNELNVKN